MPRLASRVLLAAVLGCLSAGGAPARAAEGGATLSPTPGAVQYPVEAAIARTRRDKPLSYWLEVTPEHLKDVDPDRLKAEGAAIVVVRAVFEQPDGERLGIPSAASVRDDTIDLLRPVLLRQTGKETEIGWGVTTLPPGLYGPNGGPVERKTMVRPDGYAYQVLHSPNGHTRVPDDKKVRLRAGDVVYLGTLVFVRQNARAHPDAMLVRDEQQDAQRWMQENLPKLAFQLQKRLLAPLDHIQ